MDGVFIGVLTGIVILFIIYKAVQINKKKSTSTDQPSKGGGGGGSIGDTWEKPINKK